ncbi:Retrovirus-related Pol polyprotein from transposon 17.6 [Gossypium australe]|uniref:Retrovirus-related Pol polyprotein from transposon 17.6 n=1 Tax=Gossypium australe TaxID=47621 RepID=A0A5B6UZ02_9ROSI|nr:Retrovirus-related Pol polyprotein from transposon 17.6 [Gossypium australe]
MCCSDESTLNLFLPTITPVSRYYRIDVMTLNFAGDFFGFEVWCCNTTCWCCDVGVVPGVLGLKMITSSTKFSLRKQKIYRICRILSALHQGFFSSRETIELSSPKGCPFFFGEACVLKRKLITTTIIASPNWGESFVIICDASDYTVGAVLGQKKDKTFHVIHYASKILNST